MKQNPRFSLRGSKRSKPGFTLVELLVVIAIIAILASMTLPELSKDKKTKVPTTHCLNNLQQFGVAMALYFNDFNNQLPGDQYSQGIMFGTLLAPYIGGKQFVHDPTSPATVESQLDAYFRGYNFFQCPSILNTNNLKPLHYLANSLDIAKTKSNPTATPETYFHKLNLIPRPVDVGYLAEVNPTSARHMGITFWNFFRDYDTTFNRAGAPNGDTVARLMHSQDKRHTRQMNVTFFDSHAESRNLDTNSRGVPYKLFAPYTP